MRISDKNKQGAGFRAFYLSRSADDTMALGRALASCLSGGETILLYGTLGAGKTWFCHGLADGMQVEGAVQSPTFTLMMEHPAGKKSGISLLHFDAYRLQSPEDWYELGFSDYPGPREVAAIEWPERVEEALPDIAIRLYIQSGESTEERKIDIEFPERPEQACLERLKAAGVREVE